ncbi:MAG: hypothetical protein WCF20_15490 [Methylovirgula sp.]
MTATEWPTLTVETGFVSHKACALVNVIPAQTAGIPQKRES